MAQVFHNPNVSGISLFEDLANFVKEISYDQTQFLTRCGTAKASALTHSWTTQALRAAATNRRAGGYSPTFAAAQVTPTVKRNNQVQFMANPYQVEDSLDWIGRPGEGQQAAFDRQTYLKKKERALDLDYGLLIETTVTRDDDAGTAGQMDGIYAWASGSRLIACNGSPNLSEDLYGDLAQAISEASGQTPDTAFINGNLKRAITNWGTPIRRMAEASKVYTNSIGEYDGDFGTQKIVWDLHCTAGYLLLCKMSEIAVAFGVPVKTVEIGKTRDTRGGYVKTELTLEVRNPNTVGVMTGLAG
jgi:hypothetical protein